MAQDMVYADMAKRLTGPCESCAFHVKDFIVWPTVFEDEVLGRDVDNTGDLQIVNEKRSVLSILFTPTTPALIQKIKESSSCKMAIVNTITCMVRTSLGDDKHASRKRGLFMRSNESVEESAGITVNNNDMDFFSLDKGMVVWSEPFLPGLWQYMQVG